MSPRSRSTEECMICGEVPCVCNKKVTLPKAPPKVRAPESSEPGKPEKPALVRPSVVTSAPVLARPNVAADAMKAAAVTHEVTFEEAVRNLEPILHPNEKRKYAHILGHPLADRLSAWKAKVKR